MTGRGSRQLLPLLPKCHPAEATGAVKGGLTRRARRAHP